MAHAPVLATCPSLAEDEIVRYFIHQDDRDGDGDRC